MARRRIPPTPSTEITGIPRPGRSVKIHSATRKKKARRPIAFREPETLDESSFSPQREIQLICAEIQLHTRGKQPGVVQVLGAAFRKYHNHPQLLSKIGMYMVTTEMYRPHFVTWRGTSRNAQDAIKEKVNGQPLLVVVNEKMKQHAGFPLSSQKICQEIGRPWDLRNQKLLNAAFQILEGGGFIRKMPQETYPGGRPIAVWTHSTPENPAILYPNTAMEILNQAHIENGIYAEQLFKEHTTPTGFKQGNPHATFSRRTVFYVLARLEEAGLVTSRKEWAASPGKKGTNKIHIQLTPLCQRLMDEYRRTGKLPEPMRLRVLGTSKAK